MSDRPSILFTAFEPSGDALAAAVIVELRRRLPGAEIHAMAGPRSRAVGAELIEETCGRAVMLHDAIGQWQTHRRRMKRLAAWMKDRRIDLAVPVDSPAANWSVCELMRRHAPPTPADAPGRAGSRGGRIAHLAAPQVWAWGTWRVRKLRRLTDLVLCLLPFEPEWFAVHRVPAVFVGHPLFDPVSPPEPPPPPEGGDGARLLILPGSRSGEIRRHAAMMVRVLEELRRRHPGLEARIALVDDSGEATLRRTLAEAEVPLPGDVAVMIDRTDEALAWSSVVLAKSGTVTLQVAAHARPMVVVFNASRLLWMLLGWWLTRTRTFSLPNLLGESMGLGRIVPELVPHFGAVGPVVEQVDRLMGDASARAAQVAQLRRVCEPFGKVRFASEATDRLLALLGDRAR